MDVAEVFLLHLELELSEGLDERHALDVPDGASQLLTKNKTKTNTSLDYRPAFMNTQGVVLGALHCPTQTWKVQNVFRCTEPIMLSELLLMHGA